MMIAAGEMIGETAGLEVVGWPALGLVKAWHFFVAGFVVAHLVGVALIVAGQAIWRASRKPASPAAASATHGGPYR